MNLSGFWTSRAIEFPSNVLGHRLTTLVLKPSNLLVNTECAAKFAAICVLVLSAVGCATDNAERAREAVPPVRFPVSVVGITDARGRFREIFCEINDQIGKRYPDYRECNDALSSLGEEPMATGRKLIRAEPSLTTLVFIPGLFGECVRYLATPFSDSYDELRAEGYRVIVVPVEGRSSSAVNADIIDRTLESETTSNERLIVFGYSKGAADFMEALDLHAKADWVGRTRAFVSVAGTISGTPVADEFESAYDVLLSKFPFAHCPPGDLGAVQSLTRRVRMAWLASHHLPTTIRYFSIAAYPSTSAMNPLLSLFSGRLAQMDSVSDGQMLIEDAILPGSHLLGYANADHWAIALPFDRSASLDAALFAIGNAFPREILLRSILAYVAESLQSSE